MKGYTNNHILLILLVISAVLPRLNAQEIQSQVSRHEIRLEWDPVRQIVHADGTSKNLLRFDGSVLSAETGLLPVFSGNFNFPGRCDSLTDLRIENQIWKKITSDSQFLSAGDHPPGTLQVHYETAFSGNIPHILITILPLRKNQTDGSVEKLTSFTIVFRTVKSQKGLKSALSYASNSVLSTGRWYKMATPVAGVYRITYNDLKSIGIDPSTIDPRNLRIYGNGGGMLPEANATARPDDLVENAIVVEGELDGRFDPGDYILFYGDSPDRWIYSATDKVYRFQKNVYSDRAYYFLTPDLGAGKRISSESSTSKPATFVADRFDDHAAYEKEEVNLIKSGRQWWDKQYFDLTTTRNYPFTFPDIDAASPVTLYSHLAARSTTGTTSFTISAQGQVLKNVDISGISGSYDSDFAKEVYTTATFNSSSPSIDIKLSYNKSSSSSIGYLDFIQLNAKRLLKMNGNQMLFRASGGVQQGGVTEYRLTTQGQNLIIWDITSKTDNRQINPDKSSNLLTFTLETDLLRQFCVFDGQGYYTPEFSGVVENQDLHAIATPEYLIISHPSFLTQATRLAQFHEETSGLKTFITTPATIYNEFSSGSQDVTAIRDFIRMLYNRTEPGKGLRYVLMFGDASYDYKNRTQNNTNFVPSYQSAASLSPTDSFVSDDYFALMDANEGQSANGEIDLGVGRFPVFTIEQAKEAVDKVIHYCSNTEEVKNDWRNIVAFVADDQNEGGNLFLEDSEDLALVIEKNYPWYNVDKIYSDAYTMLSTPGGGRYPEVNETINKRVEKGALMINYVGHGGELGWGHERILEVADIKSWTNFDRMPIFVTATCEFSRFDDPERVSAGEWVLLNPKGGGPAMFTTSRLTYAGTNKSLLVNFYNQAFKKTNGQYLKLGDLLVASKRKMGSSPNIHSFVLLGDPAMQMAYPDLKIKTTSITSTNSSAVPDTLQALAEVTISGEIQSYDNQKVTDFNGTIFPTVFDKASENWTKANQNEGPPVQFFLRKNAIYKGKVAVTNGEFSFSFIVPKDISFQVGNGKISYYARSTETDASGTDVVKVGGYNNAASPDNQGPDLSLFINSRSFRQGGITHQNPVLIADVTDTSGINTVGNGIGHDITAILDNKTTTPYILNDYYVSDLNTFKSGSISYPFFNLAEGKHSITVKVWDVYNNSTTKTIEFEVANSSSFALDRLYNYPNPMTTQTTFAWESNQTDRPVEAEIAIYNLQGTIVRILRDSYNAPDTRRNTLTWDGTRDGGGKVSAGLYIYRLKLTPDNGTPKYLSAKLVVL